LNLSAFSIEEIRGVLHQNIKVKAAMTPEEWAETVYRLPSGAHFRWSYAPYARAMFRSLFDPRTIETCFRLYSRGLKSTVVLLAIGYVIDQAPRRILSLWPTNSQAEKWSKDNLCGELFDCTPALQFLSSTSGTRKTSQTILHKVFPGGLIDIFGANAPGDMRRAKGSFLYGDEIDAIDTTQTDEGDQLAIFNKRGDEYPDTIRVFMSYPSLIGHSRIDAKIADSDHNEWFSTCVLCGGEPFVMTRKLLRYEEGKTREARLECPRCGGLLDDRQRYEMAHGQGFENWKAQHEFKGRRGFAANAMLWPHPYTDGDAAKYPGGHLQKIAEEEVAAKKSEDPRRSLRVLVNTTDAESFDPTTDADKPPDWKIIFDGREDYGLIVPTEALFLTAFVDCQLNRLEVEWKAWGRDEEQWGMDHVTLDGNVRKPEVWEKLVFEFQRKWTHESGAPMDMGFALIDGGYYAEDVYRFMQRLAKRPVDNVTGKVRASKGMGQHGHPIINRKFQTVAKTLKGHHIGTWEAKSRIYQRLKMATDQKAGRMHYNQQFSEEFCRQLCVEVPTIDYVGAEEVRKFANPKHDRNEALDLEVGNLAAFRLHPRNLDAIELELKSRAEEMKGVRKKEEPDPSLSGPAFSARPLASSWL
jgi:phage terminase large subunit GpA-like protein